MRRKPTSVNQIKQLCMTSNAEALLLLVSEDGRVYSFCSEPFQDLVSHMAQHRLVEHCIKRRGPINLKTLVKKQQQQDEEDAEVSKLLMHRKTAAAAAAADVRTSLTTAVMGSPQEKRSRSAKPKKKTKSPPKVAGATPMPALSTTPLWGLEDEAVHAADALNKF